MATILNHITLGDTSLSYFYCISSNYILTYTTAPKGFFSKKQGGGTMFRKEAI